LTAAGAVGSDAATMNDAKALLDDDTPPPPMTFAQRLPIVIVGGVAIVTAAGLLVWALSGDHGAVSPRSELNAAGVNHHE